MNALSMFPDVTVSYLHKLTWDILFQALKIEKFFDKRLNWLIDLHQSVLRMYGI